MWGGGNDLLKSHNNCALQCELWMWTMPETGIHLFFGTAHPQKGVPRVRLQEGKPSSGRGNSSRWGSSKATPKKGLSTPPASQPSPRCIGQGTSHHHKSHKKDSGERRKKADDGSLARRGAGHKACKDGGRR